MFKELKLLGTDVDEALERFGGNAELYRKFIIKFLKNADEYNPDSAFESGDYDEAFKRVHALKGVSGNLSFVPLYTAYSEITELLRAGSNAEAQAKYSETKSLRDSYMECIRNNF